MAHKYDLGSVIEALRLHLKDIQNARSLATAVRSAQAALAIEYEKPSMNHISVVGSFGQRSDECFCAITLGPRTAQMTLANARIVAHNILEQCALAEQDQTMMIFLKELELPERGIHEYIRMLREFRARSREDLKGLGFADTEDAPPTTPTA